MLVFEESVVPGEKPLRAEWTSNILCRKLQELILITLMIDDNLAPTKNFIIAE